MKYLLLFPCTGVLLVTLSQAVGVERFADILSTTMNIVFLVTLYAALAAVLVCSSSPRS